MNEQKMLSEYEIRAIVKNCEFPGLRFVVGRTEVLATPLDAGDAEYHYRHGEGELYLRVQREKDRCNFTGRPVTWEGRRWLLDPDITRSQVVQTAFLAALQAMEHEIREQFRYQGAAVYQPHYDVDKLLELRRYDCTDFRANGEHK